MSEHQPNARRPSWETLSFVGTRKKSEPGHPRHWWRVEPTGDYIKDCELGTRLGLEYLTFEEADQGTHLQLIVADMPRKLTGLEIGFLSAVSQAASAGAHRARAVSAYWDHMKAKEKAARKSARAKRGVRR